MLKAIETKYRGCLVPNCDRPLCARGLCCLHWERQNRTGTTDEPVRRCGPMNSMWKGNQVSYTGAHARMTALPRPPACALCGTTEGRFEWALRPDVPEEAILVSKNGYRYSVNPADYFNLCKECHNALDLGRSVCKRGHALVGDNLYVQPSNGKHFCRECQKQRRRRRYTRSARFEFGESG